MAATTAPSNTVHYTVSWRVYDCLAHFSGTNALFERKGFRYIAVNAGYWILTLMIMGGIICQFT